jgi:hypothetical protein
MNNKENTCWRQTAPWAKHLYQPSSIKAQTWQQELTLSSYQEDYHEYLSCMPSIYLEQQGREHNDT